MPISARNAIVFNAAAIIIAVSAVGAVVKSFIVRPSAEPCEERTRNVMPFQVEKAGVALTGADLQARYGVGRDAGLLEHLEIGPMQGAPQRLALKVRLPAGSGGPVTGGVVFPWQTRAIREQKTVCLAYDVLLPADFETQQNFILPGVVGGNEIGDEQFAAHVGYFGNGEGGAMLQVVLRDPNAAHGAAPTLPGFELEAKTFDMPKGRWVRINQEVGLNAPNASDGVLRIWLDGRLALERTNMRWRSDDQLKFSGVAIETHLMPTDVPVQKFAADVTVGFTPYALRW